ncbi:uncharacterized protein LOC144455046 [Phascolarctos cinereus]
MRWGEGFLCIYAVDFIKTFVDMSLFYQQLCRVKGSDKVALVLVANKIDEAHWLIDSDMGEEAARGSRRPACRPRPRAARSHNRPSTSWCGRSAACPPRRHSTVPTPGSVPSCEQVDLLPWPCPAPPPAPGHRSLPGLQPGAFYLPATSLWVGLRSLSP